MQVALIDTGYANLRSVVRALERAGEGTALTVQITHAPEVIRSADKVVVPGQGGFGDCLRGLRAQGADEAVLEHIRAGKPYFGICLGLQALFEGSEESPETPGLGVFAGQCKRLGPAPGIKIPHMGWNELEFPASPHPVLEQAGRGGLLVLLRALLSRPPPGPRGPPGVSRLRPAPHHRSRGQGQRLRHANFTLKRARKPVFACCAPSSPGPVDVMTAPVPAGFVPAASPSHAPVKTRSLRSDALNLPNLLTMGASW